MVFHQYETGVRSGTIKPGVTKYEINFVRAKTTPDMTNGVRPQPILGDRVETNSDQSFVQNRLLK